MHAAKREGILHEFCQVVFINRDNYVLHYRQLSLPSDQVSKIGEIWRTCCA